MKITDLDGKIITIENLQLALLQADDYRHYRVASPLPNQLHLYAYWEDLYQKLVALQKAGIGN
jgi:hypothetical protein